MTNAQSPRRPGPAGSRRSSARRGRCSARRRARRTRRRWWTMTMSSSANSRRSRTKLTTCRRARRPDCRRGRGEAARRPSTARRTWPTRSGTILRRPASRPAEARGDLLQGADALVGAGRRGRRRPGRAHPYEVVAAVRQGLGGAGRRRSPSGRSATCHETEDAAHAGLEQTKGPWDSRTAPARLSRKTGSMQAPPSPRKMVCTPARYPRANRQRDETPQDRHRRRRGPGSAGPSRPSSPPGLARCPRHLPRRAGARSSAATRGRARRPDGGGGGDRGPDGGGGGQRPATSASSKGRHQRPCSALCAGGARGGAAPTRSASLRTWTLTALRGRAPRPTGGRPWARGATGDRPQACSKDTRRRPKTRRPGRPPVAGPSPPAHDRGAVRERDQADQVAGDEHRTSPTASRGRRSCPRRAEAPPPS